MPRKKSGKGPNINAAIAGSKEVTAELTGNKSAAEKFGMAEKSSRDRSSRGGRSSRPRSRISNDTSTTQTSNLRAGSFPDLELQWQGTPPVPAVVKGYSGQRSYEAYTVWQDPYATNGSGLFGVLNNLVSLEAMEATNPTPAGSESQLGGWFASLAFNLFGIASGKGLNTSGFFSTTMPVSLSAYYNTCHAIFCRLRTLQGLAGLMGYNAACTRVAGNILLQQIAIKDFFTRLAQLPFPTAVYDHADKMIGVFLADDNSGTPPFFEGVASDPTYDLGDPTALSTYLGEIGLLFAGLQTANAADLSNIVRVFSFLYGTPKSFGPAPKHVSTQSLMMHMTRGMAYFQTGANVFWNAPSLDNTVARGIRTHVWGDANTCDSQWFTLWRPTWYYFANNAGAAATGPRGVYSQDNTANGTITQWYDSQDGTRTTELNTGAAAKVLSINAGARSDWAFPWMTVADQLTPAVDQVQTDNRVLPGYTSFYPLNTEVIDDTVELMKNVFIGSISGSSLRTS